MRPSKANTGGAHGGRGRNVRVEWQAKKAKGSAEEKPEDNATNAKAGIEAKAKGDGLQAMAGIGHKTLEKLTQAGINNREDLLRAGVKVLAEKTGISPKKITAWRRAARAEN